MSEFNVRSENVDVEQIMRQIRGRIRDKRGVDYTEEQIQELARVKLEKFLDPKGVRSDLLEQFRRMPADVPPTYSFDDQTLFQTDKAIVRFFRRLLRPILKLLFNPNPLIQVLDQQVAINRFLLDRTARDVLFYEVVHNLVLEMTRTSIEVKNMKMRVESIASRLEFNERRARALEAVVQYRPESERAARPQDRDRDRDRDRSRDQRERRVVHSRPDASPEPGGVAAPNPPDPLTGGESLRSRRKRRRRGRRSGPGFEDNGVNPSDGRSEGTPREGTPVNPSEGTPEGNPRERTPVHPREGSRLIQVQPWDKSLVKPIEKAILLANIGINPAVDGNIIRLPLPDLSRERRQELVKVIHRLAEEGKVSIRNIRRDAIDQIKKQLKDGKLSEDEDRRLEKEVQQHTDKHIKDIEAHVVGKEKELLVV